MVLLLANVALAAELIVWAPRGPAHEGEQGEVGLHCVGCDAPLSAEGVSLSGASLQAVRPTPEGGLRVQFVAPPIAGSVAVKLAAEGLTAQIPVLPLAAPALTAGAVTEGSVAAGVAEVVFTGPSLPELSDLVVRASEGEVRSVERGPDGIRVVVGLGSERFARPLLVAALDLREPARPPAIAQVRLRARHSGSVNAEPGSKVTLRIGGRSYGPFVADSSGSVPMSFEVLPGEASYELSVSDDLGNTQKLSQSAPGSPTPAFVGVDLRDERGGELWLAAVDGRGGQWTGPPPVCRAGVGVPTSAAEFGRGRWRWRPAEALSSEASAGCTLGGNSLTTRLGPAAGRPTSINLRVYPDVVSTDFPLAQVQASLVSATGAPVAPDGLRLIAERGTLKTATTADALRADYDGTDAAAVGEDLLRAEWSAPAGRGAVRSLELCVGGAVEAPVAVVRALDGQLRPLAGVPVRLGVVGSGAELFTDQRGFASFALGAQPRAVVLRAEASGVAERLVGGGLGVEAGCVDRANPQASDLTARVRLPFQTGRVRQVYLDAEPRTLTLGPGATASIRVRMLDSAGGLVRDEQVKLSASEGAVSEGRPQADGSVLFEFVPAPGAVARDVEITATTSAGTVATRLGVQPRPVRGTVSAGFGWVSNFSSLSSPYGTLALDHGLPVPGLAVHVGVGIYGIADLVPSEVGDAAVTGTFAPLELGLTYARRERLVSLGAGVSAVLVPYQLSVDWEGAEPWSTLSLAQPGVRANGSAGWRIGQTELYAELAYLLYTVPSGAVSLAQNAGGLNVIVGYRLLY